MTIADHPSTDPDVRRYRIRLSPLGLLPAGDREISRFPERGASAQAREWFMDFAAQYAGRAFPCQRFAGVVTRAAA